MADHEERLEADRAILLRLSEILQKVALASDKYVLETSPSQTGLTKSVNDLTGRINTLIETLGQSSDYKVEVSVTGADGAIQDLVSRVIEEVIIRVKQENLLTITTA